MPGIGMGTEIVTGIRIGIRIGMNGDGPVDGDTGTWGWGAVVDPPVPRSKAEPEVAFPRLISRLFSLLGKGGEREGNEDRCR